MKKTLHIILAVLLLAGLLAQCGKNPSAPSTEQTQKNQEPSGSPNSSAAPQTQKDSVIQQAIDDMVWVEGGTFKMGATAEQVNDAWGDEEPAHQVTLSGYYIGRYEVTQELWQAVMGTNPSKSKKNPKYPVENVSWNDCQEFITKLNALTGMRFRLPTEAEWEYAARGGNKSRGCKYAGSNTPDDVAWYKGNNNDTVRPVGQKSPNELGLYDMTGNVWEWCADWYDDYSSSSQTNPTGASSGDERVDRGGGWYSEARDCRVSKRYHDSPEETARDLGLRLALNSTN